MNEKELKRYAIESVLVIVFIGAVILFVGGGLLYFLDHYGYEFYKPFNFLSWLKDTVTFIMVFIFGFAFGVIAIFEKLQNSSSGEIE